MSEVSELLLPLLLQASVMAGILAAIVWVICRFNAKWIRPELAILLWTIVILRLLVVSGPASQFSLMNLLTGQSRIIQTQVEQSASMQTSFFNERAARAGLTTSLPRLASVSSWGLNLWSLVTWTWVSISAYCLIRLLVSAYRSCLKPVSETQEVPIELGRIYTECLVALRIKPNNAPALSVSPMAPVPSISGFKTFLITLPQWSLSELGKEQLRLVLLHELVHYQRRDVWRQWLYCLVASLHWFNPITHLVISRLMQLHELTCDRRSIQMARSVWGTSPRLYGETILQIASRPASIQAIAPITQAPLTIGFVREHHSLRERILMLSQKDSPRNIGHQGMIALVLVLLMLVGFTTAQEQAPAIQPSDSSGESAAAQASEQLFLIDVVKIYRGTREAGDQVAELLVMNGQQDRCELSELDCESFEKCGFTLISSPKLLVKAGNVAEVSIGGEIPVQADGEMKIKSFGFAVGVEVHDRRMVQNKLHAIIKLSDNYPFPIYQQDEFQEIQTSIAIESGELFTVRLDSNGPIALGELGDRKPSEITTYVVMRVNPQPTGLDPANVEILSKSVPVERQSNLGEPRPCCLEMKCGEYKKFLNGTSKPQVVMTNPTVADLRYGQCDFEVVALHPGVIEVSIPRQGCPPERVRINVTQDNRPLGEPRGVQVRQ